MTKLTVAAIKRYRPTDKRREIADGGGLYLVIQPKPSGAKGWALRYRRPDGRPAKLALGAVDLSGHEPASTPTLGTPLSLHAARALATEQKRERARGIDVAAVHVTAKRRQRQAVAGAAATSFAAMARRFVDEYARKETRRWRETAALFGFDYPRDGQPGEPSIRTGSLAVSWRRREVRSITGDDVLDIVSEAKHIGVPGRRPRRNGANASRARAIAAALSRFFVWATEGTSHQRQSGARYFQQAETAGPA
jgi:hypothetical protein